ncbi:MAG TPA: hypothetical protein V6C52_09395 [Coleofasciculaceae cyanobacterium]|jgi:hypothetical protein
MLYNIANYGNLPFTSPKARSPKLKPATSAQLAGPTTDVFIPSVRFSAKHPINQPIDPEIYDYIVELDLPQQDQPAAAQWNFETKLTEWLNQKGYQGGMQLKHDPQHPERTTISTTSDFLKDHIEEIMDAFPEVQAIFLGNDNPFEEPHKLPG